jgi:hypothetical protein
MEPKPPPIHLHTAREASCYPAACGPNSAAGSRRSEGVRPFAENVQVLPIGVDPLAAASRDFGDDLSVLQLYHSFSRGGIADTTLPGPILKNDNSSDRY